MTALVNVFAILGGLLCLYEIVVVMRRASRNWRRFSWDAIQKATDKLTQAITGSKFEPDLIVGLGRGGAIAAGLIAARLRQRASGDGRVIPISAIDRVYLTGRNGTRRDVVVAGIHALDVYGKRVLVLNADTYSGATLHKAVEALRPDEPKEIKTASLFVYMREGKKPAYAPSYWGEDVPVHKVNKRLPWRAGGYPLEEEVDFRETRRVLVALHGLVATGKTSVADAITRGLGLTPIYSDWYWFKYGLHDRDVDPSVSVRHNNHMLDLCWSVIASDRDVVLDCTTRWPEYRREILESFGGRGVHVIFVRCVCTEESALARIEKRIFIGPHDFGTRREYDRIKHDYKPIDAAEQSVMNLVEVNTDKLSCSVVNQLPGDADGEIVSEVCNAIEKYYAVPLRNRQSTQGRQNQRPA